MNSEMQMTRAINPLVGMITQPRATMRDILDTDPGYQVNTLAIIGGMASQVLAHLMTPTGFGGSLILQAALGAVSGLVGVYLGGAVFGWAGRLLGGRGTAREVRAALAWAYVPALFATLLVFLGAEVSEGLGLEDTFVFVALAIIFVGQIWATVVQLKAIGEAHEFSAWRALAMVMIVSLVLAFVIFVVGIALLSMIDSSPLGPGLSYYA